MYDCIVIGGGPAGLSAAINLVQRGKTALVLSYGASLLAKAERVDNYLGMPALTGAEMMRQFTAHATQAGAELRSAKAGNVMPFDKTFMVNADGDILEARSIILACGVSKAKPVPGESELLGRGVSYCATCDGMLYKGRTVAVWGLSEEAAREAAFLADIGCKVLYIAGKEAKLPEGVQFMKGRVEAVQGEDAVTGVTVNGETVPVEGVFILRNATPPGVLLDGLETAEGAVRTDVHMATNIPGVFAAGDMAGKPLQVSKAVGEGLVAALSAAEYLDAQV